MKAKRSVTKFARAKSRRAGDQVVNVPIAELGAGQSSGSMTLSVLLPTDLVEKADRIAFMAKTDRNTVFCVLLALDLVGRLGMGKGAEGG